MNFLTDQFNEGPTTTALTVREAAKRLHVSASLIYALCHRRQLRHERHGLGRGKILIPEDALEEYRRQHTVGAEAGAVEPAPALKHITLRE
jgi:excisionase family DNA binding protein